MSTPDEGWTSAFYWTEGQTLLGLVFPDHFAHHLEVLCCIRSGHRVCFFLVRWASPDRTVQYNIYFAFMLDQFFWPLSLTEEPASRTLIDCTRTNVPKCVGTTALERDPQYEHYRKPPAARNNACAEMGSPTSRT